MAEIDRKADEFVGGVKESAGKLTGDDDLRGRGAADQARAKVEDVAADSMEAVGDAVEQVKLKVEQAGDKAVDAKEAVGDAVEHVKSKTEQAGDKAAQVAHDVHADDRRVWVTAAAAGVIVLVLLARRAAKSRTVRRGAIIGATTGIAHAPRS